MTVPPLRSRPRNRADSLSLAVVVAGLLGSLAVARLLPALTSPGLRGLLVVLPSVAALLAAASLRLRAGSWPVEERWALAAALALVGGHDRLGFAASDHLAALVLFALLALRVVRLAPAVARHLVRRRALTWLAAIPLAAGLAVLPWTGAERPPDGDEPYYLLLAESLATDFDVDLTDEYASSLGQRIGRERLAPQIGDPVGEGGEQFSRHEPLLPLVLVPFWVLGGVAGARLAMVLLATSFSLATLAWMQASGVRPRGSLRAWLVTSLLPPALLFATQIWVEVPAALLLALALLGMTRLRARTSGRAPRDVAMLALPLILLPLLKVRFLALALPLAVAAMVGHRVRPRLRWAAGLAAAAGLLVLVANALVWGNPLRMHDVAELALLDVPLATFLRGGSGLFFDVAFGLFAAAPIWLLVLPGGARLIARRGTPALAAAACLPYLVLVASRREWYGGWAPPFRYGFVLLPLLALALALALERRLSRGRAALVAALTAASALVAAALLYEPGWANSLAAGSSSLLDRFSAAFAGDLVRFFPSSVRPRTATWAVPLLSVAAFALLAWRSRGRPPSRDTARAAGAGVAALLIAVSLLLWGAHRLPTRVAEMEDPWIRHDSGALWPDRWTIDRTRFAGGWVIASDDAMEVVPVPGGRATALTVHWKPNRRQGGAMALEVLLGERHLVRFEAAAGGGWRASRVEEVEWPAGGRLVLRGRSSPGTPPASVVVDRVEFEWR